VVKSGKRPLTNLMLKFKTIYVFCEKGGIRHMKIKDFVDKDVFASDEKIGEVKDIEIDPELWKITHLEIQLTKEAANELLGAKISIRNMLAISALKKGDARWTNKGLHLKVSKDQLHMYLRPIAET
jgi:sporulation protein YlmC with PRC-barrel domain